MKDERLVPLMSGVVYKEGRRPIKTESRFVSPESRHYAEIPLWILKLAASTRSTAVCPTQAQWTFRVRRGLIYDVIQCVGGWVLSGLRRLVIPRFSGRL